MRYRSIKLAAGTLTLAVLVAACQCPPLDVAQKVSVDATATGRFGSRPNGDPPPGDDMVVGYVFDGPGTIGIDATGFIALTNADPPPPNAILNAPPDGVVELPRFRGGLIVRASGGWQVPFVIHG